jgi:hypothetical protein
MTLEELVRSIKASEPELRHVADDAARDLLKKVLEQIRKEIESTRNGVLRVAVLGRFRIKERRHEKDGRMQAVKRIRFSPSAGA